MISITSVRRFGMLTAASAVLLFSAPVFAQEADITPDHLKAARAAVAAIDASDPYDGILPDAAAALKQTLIQKNPDLQSIIEQTVDEKTLALAPRRADLEKEAAMAYAKAFTQEELTAVATFYESPAGKKLISDGPIVILELRKAAAIWQRGVARDLALEVGKTLDAYMAKNAPAGQTPVPTVGGEAPVVDGATPPAAPAN